MQLIFRLVIHNEPLCLKRASNITNPCPERRCSCMYKNCYISTPATRDVGQGNRRWAVQTADFRLAAKRLWVIVLSCRACGAGAGYCAWIPGRNTFGVHPQPLISKGIAKMYFGMYFEKVFRQVLLNCDYLHKVMQTSNLTVIKIANRW